MSRRFWLLGLLGLVLAGLLVACGTAYNSSTDGLLVVGSQGSGLLESFAFNLNTGTIGAVTNTPFNTANESCQLNGSPSDMVMNPAGTFAYVIFNKTDQCPNATQFGVAIFQVNSDGTIAQVGKLLPFTPETVSVQGNSEQVPVAPSTLAIDAAGKFVFMADRATVDSAGVSVPGAVSVFAVGSGGSLTEVPGSPFLTPANIRPLTSDIISVAPTPTVFPNVGINGTQNSVCSIPGSTPPTAEFLYAVDTLNYGVWEFSVDTTTGALGNPPFAGAPAFFPSDKVPVGVAVDPCDRFAYVSNSLTNKISGYQICSFVIQSGQCPNADGSLVPVVGSPFTMPGSVESPGPIEVDPYGNNVYVVGTLSNTVSIFKISPQSGAISAASPPTIATGQGPVSLTIRQDDNWLFVANFGTGSVGGSTVSQYSVTPATGALTVLPAIQTDNLPFGVAVK